MNDYSRERASEKLKETLADIQLEESNASFEKLLTAAEELAIGSLFLIRIHPSLML